MDKPNLLSEVVSQRLDRYLERQAELIDEWQTVIAGLVNQRLQADERWDQDLITNPYQTVKPYLGLMPSWAFPYEPELSGLRRIEVGLQLPNLDSIWFRVNVGDHLSELKIDDDYGFQVGDYAHLSIYDALLLACHNHYDRLAGQEQGKLSWWERLVWWTR